jgi:hypothetical protein
MTVGGGIETDRLRAANPFGTMDGAYFAWKVIQAFRVTRGSVLV